MAIGDCPYGILTLRGPHTLALSMLFKQCTSRKQAKAKGHPGLNFSVPKAFTKTVLGILLGKLISLRFNDSWCTD